MFINTKEFSREAERFIATGRYCDDPDESPGWIAYWQEQLNRCINGYSVGGTKITGDHYFYLNFCRIKLTQQDHEVVNKKKAGRKIITFPDFWDGDYDYFWVKEIARNGISPEEYKKLNLSIQIKPDSLSGGKHIIIAKARRKGYSYKNGAIVANKYNTERNSLSLICAFDKKYLYPKGTMGMVLDYINFINEATGWTKKRDVVNKQEHLRASYKYTTHDGAILEKGYKSEVIAISFKDNPDAGRGKDASLILLEEAGKFPNLKASYASLKPTVEDGVTTTGQIVIFGTGGEGEVNWVDFEDMFYNPDSYNLIAFENQWDENARTSCGFYVPDYRNKPGFIDKHGNSIEKEAKDYEQAKRDDLQKKAKDKKLLDRHIVEYPFCPKETFLRIKGNIFPGADLQRQLAKLETENDDKNYWLGELVLSEQHPYVAWKPNTTLTPLLNFPLKRGQDTTGCVILYEPPFEIEDQVPDNMYIAATDPYRQDEASDSPSVGSTIVYNRLTKRIVAEYTARPETAKDYYEVVRRLLVYYNAPCLYENEVKGMFDYFEFKNCLYLLADEPTELIRDVIKDSHVTRKKGIHMTKELKAYGENLIKTWLIEPVDDLDMNILNMHKLRSQPMIKELIAYNPDNNFDRVSALMILMYHIMMLRKISADPHKETYTFTDSTFFKLPQFQKPKYLQF